MFLKGIAILIIRHIKFSPQFRKYPTGIQNRKWTRAFLKIIIF